MPDTIRCPDCGHENPAGAEHCSQCNFPLRAAAPGGAEPGRSSEPEIVIRRPVRPRRPRPAGTSQGFLWMFLGGVAAVMLIWTAYTSFRKTNSVPVAGATEEQQRAADSLRAVLARDSTNVDANIEYGNLLYDTANWPEAARAYARAIARDSSRVEAIVDMGVCWYNMSDPNRARDLFQLALGRHPGHPVALFNLGIVSERAGDNTAALRYYHEALQAQNAPEELKQQVVAHMQAILQKTGEKPPPLPQGTAPGSPGGGPNP